MRSSEIARLSGVSARSIRHYHRLGVLPEPERTPGGYRDYTVADLVRVMRIRAFLDAGVPLRTVPAMLAGTSGMGADLDALMQELDTRIETLQMRRARLTAIAAAADAGNDVGALPAEIETALARCVADAQDEPLVHEVLAREREALELLAITHGIPQILHDTYRWIGQDEQARESYLDLVGRMARLRGWDPADCRRSIDDLAADIQRTPALRSLLVPGDPEVRDRSDGAADATHGEDAAADGGPLLTQLVPDRAQRAVIERILAPTDDTGVA